MGPPWTFARAKILDAGGVERENVRMGMRLPTRVICGAVATLSIALEAADQGYHEQFTQTSETTKGYIWQSRLVDTNNARPDLTNAAVLYSNFAARGELAGVKLGMTMGDVVAVWGKPRRLFTHCIIGPRFWYGPKGEGDTSLFFVSNRLVLIAVDGDAAKSLKFDNGLTGARSRAECEKLLGEPALRDPETESRPYVGAVAYRTGALRVDLGFYVPGEESLGFIAVSLEKEAVKKGHEDERKDASPHRDTKPEQ